MSTPSALCLVLDKKSRRFPFADAITANNVFPEYLPKEEDSSKRTGESLLENISKS